MTEIALQLDDLPDEAFSVIYADPPWHHKSRSAKGQTRRSPSHHYRTMSLKELRALPVARVAAKNAHLFFWTTGPHLQHAFAIMEAWGFRYSALGFTWVKLNPREADALFLTEHSFHVGMGYTTRKNVEICLLGRRGAPKRMSKSVRELIIAARREHSRKPDEALRRIERYATGPYLELFGREQRDGWTVLGNEPDKFTRAA